MVMRTSERRRKDDTPSSRNTNLSPSAIAESLSNELYQWLVSEDRFSYDSIFGLFRETVEEKSRNHQGQFQEILDGLKLLESTCEEVSDLSKGDLFGEVCQNEKEMIIHELEQSGAPKEVKKEVVKLYSEDNELERKELKYVNYLREIPWDQTEPPRNWTTEEVKYQLNESHHGLNKLKDRILDELAALKRSGDTQTALLLNGPAGTGKTTIAQAIADGMNRPLVRINLGGLHDVTELVGMNRSWRGSQPSQLIRRVIQAETLCPVFLLDEIDKLTEGNVQNPSDAVLQLLDPEQNDNFQDNYIEYGVDISNAIFIATSNNKEQIPRPLLDRFELLDFDGYTPEDKIVIARDYILPGVREDLNLKDGELTITEEAYKRLADAFSESAGVRDLQKNIRNLARKAIRGDESLTVTPEYLNDFLDTNEESNLGFTR